MSRISRNLELLLHGGSIIIPAGSFDEQLENCTSIALMVDGSEILFIPLIGDSPGGLIIKIRNAKGDRIVNAHEFFRNNGLSEDLIEKRYSAAWDETRGAFRFDPTTDV